VGLSDLKAWRLVLSPSAARPSQVNSVNAFECVATKLDVREFQRKQVPARTKLRILEAARMTGSGKNVQHWKFILVQDRENLRKLAEDSTSGKWVERSDFAVVVLTDPKYGFHLIDAGRVAQDMQIAAWNDGVASCVFTGVNREALQKDFNIPSDLTPSIIIGFGFPSRKITGRKDRKSLHELAFHERYGEVLDKERF
jgi:nitroreductase